MSDELASRVVSSWWQQRLPFIRRPATAHEIDEFERKQNVHLPMDMRELYLAADGFEQQGNSYDANGFNFFPLSEVRGASDPRNGSFSFKGAGGCYVFCEYLSWCWGYGIFIEKGNLSNGVVIVGGAGDTSKLLAPSFSKFLELHLEDDSRLYVAKD